ncbi:VOC family protein [Devosia sp.]|uniref:VOC family protein n=1 Tax=Devosia sp. TaxID=1871048 RepID=UPI001ACF11F7|nr:VOC family protein [Devosia sp.]MBN9310030.1 VOC family protein [Devosia sp.]
MSTEPILDLAQLAHVEILTPDLEGSVRFFTAMLGLSVTERRGDSTYLRAYEERQHHSLKLTRAPQAGLGHVSWRVRSSEALERRAAAIEATGRGRGWIEGDAGHGRAYQFDTPNGHRWELVWDVARASVPAAEQSGLINRGSRRPAAGIPARRIDHYNLTAPDVGAERDFLVSTLGFMEREAVVTDDGAVTIASWLSVTNLSHDLALVPEGASATGRLHHVCFYGGTNEALFDLADLCREHGIALEHGPGRHGIGKTTFLYMMEPGGNRIEMVGDAGALIFDPTFETVRWTASQLPTAAVWTGTEMPASFWNYATPGAPADARVA